MIEVTCDFRNLTQHLDEMSPLCNALTSSLIQQLMRDVAAEFLSQQHHGAFGEYDAMGSVDIRAHTSFVHRKPFHTSAIDAAATPVACIRAAIVGHSACQVPTARSCSCTIPERKLATSPEPDSQRRELPRTRSDCACAAWSRTAAARSAGLGDLTDFALHQQADVARHFSQRPGQDSAGADQRGQPIPVCMPGCVRETKLEFLRQLPSHCDSVFAERCQCAGRAAELNHQAFVKCRLEPHSAAANRAEPSRGLESERRRWRGLQQSAPQHHGIRVGLGEPPQTVFQTGEI